MTYNWQHPHWPNFTYDGAQCKTTVYQYALEAGRLSGMVGQMAENVQYDIYIDLMTCEAQHSSAIEGEQLASDDIQATIRNCLGLNQPNVEVDNPRAQGIGRLMVDVRKTFGEPLSEQKLLQWQQMVTGGLLDEQGNPQYAPGQWRESKQPPRIVAVEDGVETINFIAPQADDIANQIGQFIDWYNRTNPMESPSAENTLSGPVRAAIAHLWFESIHPFEHGNGRVGRAIAEQALAQDLGHPPMLSLSTQMKKYANAYYRELNSATSDTMDITPWVNWFAQSVLSAQRAEAHRVDGLTQRAAVSFVST